MGVTIEVRAGLLDDLGTELVETMDLLSSIEAQLRSLSKRVDVIDRLHDDLRDAVFDSEEEEVDQLYQEIEELEEKLRRKKAECGLS